MTTDKEANMAWNIIRNSEPATRTDSFSGECPKFRKTATITIHSTGSVYCKTDLQKTYRKSGARCSLLECTNESAFSPCMENCPLVPEKYL